MENRKQDKYLYKAFPFFPSSLICHLKTLYCPRLWNAGKSAYPSGARKDHTPLLNPAMIFFLKRQKFKLLTSLFFPFSFTCSHHVGPMEAKVYHQKATTTTDQGQGVPLHQWHATGGWSNSAKDNGALAWQACQRVLFGSEDKARPSSQTYTHSTIYHGSSFGTQRTRT